MFSPTLGILKRSHLSIETVTADSNSFGLYVPGGGAQPVAEVHIENCHITEYY